MEKGNGSNNGIRYSYQLTKKGWCGSYECRIHRSFLDNPSLKVCTKTFSIGGYKWNLEVVHHRDGFLGLYIQSQNKREVTIHCSFSLLNKLSKKKDILQGFSDTFPRGKTLGRGKIASIRVIKDPNSGFLFEDAFVVRIGIRLSMPDNEAHQIHTDAMTCLYTWKLKHPFGTENVSMRSKGFKIGDSHWRIKLQREEIENPDCFGIFLYNMGTKPSRAQIRFSVVNHDSRKQNISKEVTNTIHPGSHYGQRRFLKIKTITNESVGFVKNGWMALAINVKLLHDIQVPSMGTLRTIAEEGTEQCVVCLANPRTSGILHGSDTHQCLCIGCAQKLELKKDLLCPICNRNAERIIYHYF